MHKLLQDVMLGIGSLGLFIVMLIVLPFVMESGVAYLVAIIVFIVTMGGAGYLINVKAA